MSTKKERKVQVALGTIPEGTRIVPIALSYFYKNGEWWWSMSHIVHRVNDENKVKHTPADELSRYYIEHGGLPNGEDTQ